VSEKLNSNLVVCFFYYNEYKEYFVRYGRYNISWISFFYLNQLTLSTNVCREKRFTTQLCLNIWSGGTLVQLASLPQVAQWPPCHVLFAIRNTYLSLYKHCFLPP